MKGVCIWGEGDGHQGSTLKCHLRKTKTLMEAFSCLLTDFFLVRSVSFFHYREKRNNYEKRHISCQILITAKQVTKTKHVKELSVRKAHNKKAKAHLRKPAQSNKKKQTRYLVREERN